MSNTETEMRSGPVGVSSFVPRAAVLVGWQADWERWAGGREAQAALRRWSGEPLLAPHLSACAVLLAACGRDRQVPMAVADRRLAALVGRARGGDTAAARVVLERVMPALTAVAGRRATGHTTFSATLCDVVSCAWLSICTYPLDTHPGKIAANVVYSAVYRSGSYRTIDERRLLPVDQLPETPTGLDGRPLDRPRPPSAELLAVLREGLAGGVPVEQLRLLGALGLTDTGIPDVAASGGISERMVRTRRQTAIRALAAHLRPDGQEVAA